MTFYTLISIVPLLAIILAIAKGFGFENFLQEEFLETFKEQKVVLSTAMEFAYDAIKNIKTQTIAGIGVLFLFFAVFGLFENIEKTLNDIWNVKKTRSFIRRFINYITALIVIPIIFISSTGITVLIHSEILKIAESSEYFHHFSKYFIIFLRLTPYALMCILFSYIYIFSPNSKIYIKPRILAGIFAGAFFQFWQIIYINMQVYITSYNIIYGSFAALPLFLIWMQVNFVIFLYGGIIAAQIENDKFFRIERRNERFEKVNLKILTLIILHGITSHYLKGNGPLSIDAISKDLGIAMLDAREALHILERAEIISEIPKRGYAENYQLIVNPEIYNIRLLCDLIDESLFKPCQAKETFSLLTVSKNFANFETAIKESGYDISLKQFAGLRC